jgi:Chain length determinant protein
MDQLSDEISLKELILKLKKWYQYILSKWVLLMLICFLGSTVGYLYAFFKKPIYTASITYTLDDDKSGSGGGLSGALGLASSFGFDLGGSAGGAFGPSNLMELMHSRYLVEKTLLSTIEVSGKKLTLADYYIEINGLRKQWQNKPDLMDVSFPVNYERKSFTRIQDSVLGSIYTTIDKDQLSITQKDKKVSIGTIEVKSTSEMFAMLFCNQLVKEVTGFYIETKSLKARNNVNIIQKQVDSVREQLNAAITGVAAANDNAFNSMMYPENRSGI